MTPTLMATGIPELLPMKRGGEPHRHVSVIIRSLCLRLGHFAGSESNPEEGRDQTRLELGCAFEDAVARALADRYAADMPGRYCRIGEIEKDGLLGTPDLLDLEAWAVAEIKLTWMSARHDPESEKFWKYWVQLKAYCHMLETQVGHLHVCHINGDYRTNRGPVYNVWRAEFTKSELAENWRMLLTHGRALEAEPARRQRR
jgi:hypothetical protein